MAIQLDQTARRPKPESPVPPPPGWRRARTTPSLVEVYRTVPVAGSIDTAAWDPNGSTVFVAGTSGTLMVCQPGAMTATDLNLPASFTFAII